ncbi:hypothetical protein QOT71_22525 [Pseudomonas aeruginosa]|uniref:hypothetical protein n=1 Tax=Pseudomonas aeruginosa TaxID=287 RepID=UPI0010684E60|nr:hypothetical protein [Pseudomonas aeruginosa]TER08099.1 hypothetical protein IPC48_21490 [Pseudomonas aeruginosa]
MPSTQHQLIKQCATRLRGIVEALDNIHDSTPHRWSTDLDDVHSSAESLLALIKDQAPVRSEASFEEWLANELEGEDGQPVPAAVCDIALARRAFNHWPKLEHPAKVGGVRFSAGVSSRLVVEAAQRLNEFESTPEQEAERPEMSPERAAYFMRRFKSEEKLLGPNEQAAVDYVLSLLAQHESIVGALRAENAKLIEALDECDGDRWKLRSERDAALAEVERLREENANLILACASLDSEKREMQHKWDAIIAMRDAALARVAEMERQEPVAAVSGETFSSDGTSDIITRNLPIGTKLYANPVAQAGQVPAAWYYDAPSQAEAAIIDIRGMWGEDDCPTYEDVASALRRLLAAAPGKEVPQAWLDVQAERRRQITAEGWTPQHDDEHADGQMAQAAGCYALHAGGIGTDWPDGRQNGAALFWPWDRDSWKPTTPRRDLVKACALALAEIERLDRATATQGGPRDA